MLGKASTQGALFSAENMYTDQLKEGSFYRYLSKHRHEIFRDEDYASLYCHTNGRQSVPPSILATACILQSYNRISDHESVQRATFDIRWVVAMGTELAEQPFAKSTLQEFRAKLILDEQTLAIFQRSLSYAKKLRFLKNRKMRIAMDTTNILGKGAVKDTYNLLADGIKKLYNSLKHHKTPGLAENFTDKFKRYFGKSFKGEASIDWDDKAARQELLTMLATDARALIDLAKDTIAQAGSDTEKVKNIQEACQLLSRLFQQDVETDKQGQSVIKKGVDKDRIIATTDPEMRHGRKSASKRFNGHKATIATDLDSGIITAVDVVSGNVHDSETALAMVEQTQENTANQVEAAIGDCAYGTAELREHFENSATELLAKTPAPARRDYLTKHDFQINLAEKTVTCPAGITTSDYRQVTAPFGKNKEKRPTLQFVFPRQACDACQLRHICVRNKSHKSKELRLHPREDLLQEARKTAATDYFKEQYRQRVKVEHSIGRLVQRGIRQSRFFGKKRTRWQVALAAAVVNLTLIAGRKSSSAGDNRWFLPFWRRIRFCLVPFFASSACFNRFFAFNDCYDKILVNACHL